MPGQTSTANFLALGVCGLRFVVGVIDAKGARRSLVCPSQDFWVSPPPLELIALQEFGLAVPSLRRYPSRRPFSGAPRHGAIGARYRSSSRVPTADRDILTSIRGRGDVLPDRGCGSAQMQLCINGQGSMLVHTSTAGTNPQLPAARLPGTIRSPFV